MRRNVLCKGQMKKKVDGRCQICYDTGHGYHFGVIACRACAAFFRRTIALNLNYKCRFEERCVINKCDNSITVLFFFFFFCIDDNIAKKKRKNLVLIILVISLELLFHFLNIL